MKMLKHSRKGMVICFLILSLMAVSKNHAKAGDKTDIQSVIAEQIDSSERIKKTYYEDFDRDGRKEAFVLTGTLNSNDYDDSPHVLWFAYKKGSRVYYREIAKKIMISSHLLKLKSITFFCAGRYSGTSVPENIYRVQGNVVRKIFEGDTIRKSGDDSFSSTESAYKGFLDAEGRWSVHTWNDYYFYWKNGKINEYTAKKISVSAFRKKYANAGTVLKTYEKQGILRNILVRSNGKVHLNYGKYDSGLGGFSFSNVTFSIQGSRLVKPVKNGGNYQKRLK